MKHSKLDILINIIVGFILGYILYRGYLFPPKIKGPNSRDVIDKVYNVNGKKYILEPVVCGCILYKK